MSGSRGDTFVIGGHRIRHGETRDIALKVSETVMGLAVSVPVRVLRGARDGPTVFVTGAVHGDELNGTGVIRELMFSGLKLERGTLLLVPVVNVFGFERHTRYLPDRRDLNRSFPGDPKGSLAFRLAHVLYTELIARSDFGIDLHTAGQGRTNFPHVRADLSVPRLEQLARWFGAEVIMDRRGDEQSLRNVATARGCLTINLEAGEALKIEPPAVHIGVRGVLNVLKNLSMLRGEPEMPVYQTIVKRSTWVRGHWGGLLRFHVPPGAIVDEGADLATCDGFFRPESPTVQAPVAGIVLGMTTLPVVRPGEPICHIGIPDRAPAEIIAEISRTPATLHGRMRAMLADRVHVVAPPVRRTRKKKSRAVRG
jgi:predicted deacylase